MWRGYSLAQELQYLKLVFLEIPNVKTWSVFQNQVTYDNDVITEHDGCVASYMYGNCVKCYDLNGFLSNELCC